MNKLIHYFKNWQPHQWVRLLFGTLFISAMIVYGFDWALLLFSSIFLTQAFMNWGCTGDTSCRVGSTRVLKTQKLTDEVVLEEVK